MVVPAVEGLAGPADLLFGGGRAANSACAARLLAESLLETLPWLFPAAAGLDVCIGFVRSLAGENELGMIG